MNVSPSNRERQTAPPNGKDTNPPLARPTRGNGHGSPSSAKARHGTEARRPTDEQLLEAYRLGEKATFNQLVDRYHREPFHFLVRFLGDRAAAEDIFQQTFLQIHQSAH